MNQPKKVAITGAAGYIGTHLVTLAMKRGYDVVIVSRRRPTAFHEAWVPFDLTSVDSVDLPKGTNIVVHLAANTSFDNALKEEGEIAAAQRLINSARSVGAKFVFVSSQTARLDAPTSYGRIKWRIEQDVLAAGGWVVRPGQVYGGELRGLFGMLVKTVRHFPLLPAFIPAPKIQPIHVDDLAEGLLRIATHTNLPSGVYCLAASKPVSFSSFLNEIAISRLRCRRGYVLLPVVLVKALATILGRKVRTRLGLERLSSLFDLPSMETKSDLEKLGLTLRTLHSGMHPTGDDRRRRLLREGRMLFAYIMKELPTNVLLRRYVRAIERLRGGQLLNLPEVFQCCPILLSLLDRSDWSDKSLSAEFAWRLDSATTLAEATPSGASRFIGIGCKHGVLLSLYSVSTAVMSETIWRIIRLPFIPLIRCALRTKKEAE